SGEVPENPHGPPEVSPRTIITSAAGPGRGEAGEATKRLPAVLGGGQTGSACLERLPGEEEGGRGVAKEEDQDQDEEAELVILHDHETQTSSRPKLTNPQSEREPKGARRPEGAAAPRPRSRSRRPAGPRAKSRKGPSSAHRAGKGPTRTGSEK
ncbi:unnamed protein product, partial [Prorocentrum cordatum]